MPDFLIPYRTNVRAKEPLVETEGAVHFFLDDSIFEPAWNRPPKGLQYVSRFGFALSPDFSLYAAFPPVLQMYNVYRNRWVGRFWQERGISVVPSVSWSDESSYDYCFSGIPRGQTVAISTVGVGHLGETGRLRRARELFRAGYEEMVRRIEPELVLLHGEVPLERFGIGHSPPVKSYPSRWQNIRRARREARERGSRERGSRERGSRERGAGTNPDGSLPAGTDLNGPASS